MGFLVVALGRREGSLIVLGSVWASVEFLVAHLLGFCFARAKDINSVANLRLSVVSL